MPQAVPPDRQAVPPDIALPEAHDWGVFARVNEYDNLRDMAMPPRPFMQQQMADAPLGEDAWESYGGDALSIKAFKLPNDGGYKFFIDKQARRGNNFAIVSSEFIHEGWRIRSSSRPEFAAEKKLLYVRGTSEMHDQNILYCENTDLFSDIIAVIDAYNQFIDSTWKKLPKKLEDLLANCRDIEFETFMRLILCELMTIIEGK